MGGDDDDGRDETSRELVGGVMYGVMYEAVRAGPAMRGRRV